MDMKTTVVYFKVLSQQFLGETEENQERSVRMAGLRASN